MTAHKWLGHAINVKQTYTITVANTWAQNDTVTVTVDGLDFVITIGTLVTTAQVATTIKQALNGETLTDTAAACTPPIADSGGQGIPQFYDFIASVNSSVVTLTARTAGKPFTVSVTESTAGDGTATGAAATANAGKHELDNADNLSGDAALLDDDTLTFDSGIVDVKYDMSLGVQLATVTKYMAYTGNVGLPFTNSDAPARPYPEYRGRYVVSDDNSVTTTFNLEVGEGRGSGRFMWDSGAGQALVNVYGRGARIESGLPCILWKGTHASNVVNNLNGDLGIAYYGGETATVATLRSGNGPTSSASTICGSGVALTAVVMTGGTLETASAFTTGTQTGGTWKHRGANTGATLNLQGGEFRPLDGMTATTLSIRDAGVFDASYGNAPVTITNPIQLYKGATFRDPHGRCGNCAFVLNGCSLEDVNIVLPPGKTLTQS